MTSTVDRLAMTALIPFWARVQDAGDDRSVLGDRAAVALAPAVAERVGVLPIDEMTQLGCCLRNYTVDRWLTQLVADGVSTIVDIGVGLDTRSARLPSLTARHIEVDDHAIIDLRNDLIPDASTVRVAADGLEVESWLPAVDPASGGTAVVLEGVLPYQDPARVHAFLATMAERAPGAFVLFDSVSPLSAAITNRAAELTDAHPPYRWSTWRTARLVTRPRPWLIVEELGLTEVPWGHANRLDRQTHFLYTLPVLRRSYRLTLARMPGPGASHVR
jgi:O-methyltransferase involved in polyketide biosynthesis